MPKQNGTDGDRPRKRFSRSGHTSHARPAPPPPPPPQYAPPSAYAPGQYGPPTYPPQQYGPPPHHDDPQQYTAPTYHHGPGEPEAKAAPAVAIARTAFTQTNRAARLVTRKVISASKADGASESGLTALIWNQVLSYGTDAMITVALAGTVFFGASTHAQRGNILLYLLITMAPFAVVAPVIGPALDRLQHGRRWTMAGTAIGRAVMALIMAGHPSDLLVLYPCALGSLVLSKAYGVVRAAAAPRLVPPGLSLTEANARLSIFGLGSTIVSGALVGVLIKLTGSYSLGLIVTAIAFGVCAYFAFRLPPQVDSAVAAPRHPQEPPRPRTQQPVPPLVRLRTWAKRGFPDHLVTALQGESVLRFLSGLLTIFLAFYVESTAHGVRAAAELGAVIGAAGIGNFAGTAVGTKLKLRRPEVVIIVSATSAAVTCILVAVLFNITMAVVGMLVSAVTNSLSKIALDALIQRDVVETMRSSAFARSETFLQLSWVLGAAVGVLLPVTHGGAIGFLVAGIVVGLVAFVVLVRHRTMTRSSATRDWPSPPGALPATHPGEQP
ncbi:MAG TPA: MFS transporter [Jatrophihabitantaceae bacterium]|nr:MFS transporter [Jatrophihabitantaceae bacterium]